MKSTKVNSEEQLLQARERGLKEAQEINSMSAHGKILGMDCFSWVNPQLDMLATVLDSFPFSIIWVGSQSQINQCIDNYPELGQKIETIILYDNAIFNLDRKKLHAIKNIGCIEGVTYALDLVKSLKKPQRVFLFTTHGPEAKENKIEFENFIAPFK